MAARAVASAGLPASGSIPRSADRSKRPNARQRISTLRAISMTLRTPAALSMMGTRGRSGGPFAARMAVRTPGASSAMAKGAPAAQALDLIRPVAGLGENGGPVTIQAGRGPVCRGELAHLDRQTHRRHLPQRRMTV